MASIKTTIVLGILWPVLLHEFESMNRAGTDRKIECDYRCSKASRQKMCIRACNTCCQRGNSVPPRTSGDKDVCPCYANMTTHGGRPKCL